MVFGDCANNGGDEEPPWANDDAAVGGGELLNGSNVDELNDTPPPRWVGERDRANAPPNDDCWDNDGDDIPNGS